MLQARTRPRRLSRDECTSWLAGHSEGRLVYTGGRGRRGVVVRYALAGDRVTLRLPDYNDIVHYAPGEQVSLLVEGRPPSGDGQVVIISIAARPEVCSGDLASAAEEEQLDETWPASVLTTLLRLPLTDVSGVLEPLGPQASWLGAS